MALLPWEDQGLQWTLVILSMELQDIESIFTCKTLYTKIHIKPSCTITCSNIFVCLLCLTLQPD